MLRLFKSRHLGIDISPFSVKIVEISFFKGNFCIESYGHELLPFNAFDGNVIKDVEAVASCIKKSFIKSQSQCQQAVLALPDSLAINKIIQIPKVLNQEEIQELVLVELEKCIPYALEEISCDFFILNNSTTNTDLLDILVIVSKTENIRGRVDAITQAGLKAKSVETESYALERAVQQLAFCAPNKIVAIFNMGVLSSQLLIMQGSNLIFSREERLGSMQLIEAMAEYYNTTLAHAFSIKSTGPLAADCETELVLPFKNRVLLQIKRTLQFFYSSNAFATVDHVLLAGELIQELALDALIQEHTGLRTTIANPLSGISLSKKINREDINKSASALILASGLALRTA